MKNILLILTLFVLVQSGFSNKVKPDSAKYPFTIGFKAHYGTILIHSRAIREIKDSYPTGFQFDFSWHLNSMKQWDNCHCYPRVGVMLNYFNYDNPKILGEGLAAIYYIEPFFGAHRKFSFSIRTGAGLTYLTRPHHPVTNPDNQSYSTHLSTFLLVNSTLHYRINEKFSVNASGAFNHSSNGGIKEPNKGINFPTVGVGLDYTLNPKPFINRDKSKFKDVSYRKQRLDFDLFGVVKSYKHGEPPEHLVFGASANLSHQIGRLSALILSAEFESNGVVKEDLRRNGIDNISHHRMGVLAGHEFLMGRYHFSTQLAAYLYRPYIDRNYDWFYHRHKLTYRFDNGIYLGVSLKAHRHVADYFDIRLGYSFARKKLI